MVRQTLRMWSKVADTGLIHKFGVPMHFANTVVLIVGASSGMGRVVALKLGAAGAKLVVTARRKDKLESLAADISAKGGECLALAAHALDERAASNVVESAVQRFGRIDVALLNAGGAPAIDMRTMSISEGSNLRGCEKIMSAIELLQDPLRQAQRPAATLDLPEHPAPGGGSRPWLPCQL